MINVSERLQQLMNERGMTTYSLAKKAHVSWNTVKNYSIHNTKPTLATLSMLCDGFGITLAQFFDTEGSTTQLTAEQQYFLDRLGMLSDKEKQVIGDMMDVIIENKD